MSNKYLLGGVAALAILAIFGGGYFLLTRTADTSQASTEVRLTQEIETPELNEETGEYVSELAELKVERTPDKYVITYPRNRFDSEELGYEIGRILRDTNLNEGNMISLASALAINESISMETESECGFTDPGSSWCFRLTNLESGEVELILKKGYFEPRVLESEF